MGSWVLESTSASSALRVPPGRAVKSRSRTATASGSGRCPRLEVAINTARPERRWGSVNDIQRV